MGTVKAMQGSLAYEFLEFIEEAPGGTLIQLAKRVLSKCRQVARAQAGTIYILRGQPASRTLEALSLQNDAIRAASKLFVVPVSLTSISGYVATTGETVFIDDVYELPPGVPYSFNRGFDQRTGYRTRSVMAFPLTAAEGRIIGVVQLLNALDPSGAVTPFDPRLHEVIGPVSLVVGRAIERADALHQIAIRNRRLKERNQELQAERERVIELQAETERAFMMSVELLARAAELHDEDTGWHIQRVNGYSEVLSSLAGLRKNLVQEISWAAALHDVGKMSIDVAVLHKKGRLDEREFREMQQHTVYGYQILKGHPRLALAAEIAHCHHEMWEGGGYPRRLAGEAIPIAARVVAIADVYDALRSPRPYKPGFDHARTVDIMLNGDERLVPHKHFDPKLLKLFRKHHDKFAGVWDDYFNRPGQAAAE